MAKVDFQPQRPHELLAVYPDEATAERVLTDLRKQMSEWTARRADKVDEQHALNAEMREEMEETILAPQAAFIAPKESARFGLALFPLAIAVGVIVSLPIMYLIPGDMSSGSRLVGGLGIGAVLGGTVALVLMALGQKRPNEPMAAERGVTVRVKSDREEIRKLMIAAKPLRLDVVDDQGRPIETIAREGDSSSAREIGKRVNNWP